MYIVNFTSRALRGIICIIFNVSDFSTLFFFLVTFHQPRSQVLSPTRRETLVGFGHVSPRIWEITNKQFGGGVDKCEICLYKA